MGNVSKPSGSLKAQLPPPYSIQRIESKAVQVAKAIRPWMIGKRSLNSDNVEEFCLFLRDKCHIPYAATKAMLSKLLPLKVTSFNMFRLALAVMNYLPRFETRDVTLEDLEEDLPNMWVHVRITDVDVREESPGRFYAYLEALCMTTVLAGRLLSFRVPYPQLKRIFCALGLRSRVKEQEVVPPRELCSMYAYLHLGDTQTEAFNILGWTASGSEKKKNRELVLLRKRKDCSHVETTCVECPLGKDQCAIACRKTSLAIVRTPGTKDEETDGTAQS